MQFNKEKNIFLKTSLQLLTCPMFQALAFDIH
jgi:hypothetical protein